MRSTINQLLQLQELTLIRDEQRSIRGPQADLTALNEAIEGLAESLVPVAKIIYQRLSKKDHIVMAAMTDGKCSMCGMRLAISQVQSVKLCRELVTCPSCARILHDNASAKGVPSRSRRAGEPPKVGVARFSAPELMVPELRAKTMQDAIAELSRALQKAGFVDDAKKLIEPALAREATCGTGVGHALAFPHVRGIEGGGLSLAFGVSRKGIPWGGVDPTKEGEPGLAHFVFFSTIPTAVSSFYLKLLAGLAEAYTREAGRKEALAAKTPDALWKALVKATRRTVK